MNNIIIEGTVESVIFRNHDNGYSVFRISVNDTEDMVCVGTAVDINVGEYVRISGYEVKHPSYGNQLQVVTYTKTVPKTENGIEKYLASGLIKGIGKRMAKRIVDKFGKLTFDIIERYPERLADIKGISLKKAVEINKIFFEQQNLREIVMFLQENGISTTYALKIYEKFKENTINVIKTNPYSLSEHIYGISFKTADEIAEKVGIDKQSPYRIKAGITFELNNVAQSQGHTYLPKAELLSRVSVLTGIPEELVEIQLSELTLSRQICIDKADEDILVFLNSYYFAENYVASKLIKLKNAFKGSRIDYEKEIRCIEVSENIKLASKQKRAVKETMKSGVMVLTGGPGTGKTTTINTIIKLLENEGLTIELTAPTGRASKRMSEATGRKAQTIHRLLGIEFMSEDSRRQRFCKNEDEPIEADVVIIDEMSMVDIMLMSSLLKAIAEGTRLVLVGDVDQLPSVGAGNVLKDIIDSGMINVVKLDEIFRQASESAIITNAHKINKGEYPILNDSNNDFFFMKKYDPEELMSTIIGLASTRLPKFKACSPFDVQILAPMRKSALGVNNLNVQLQAVLNPPSPEKPQKEYRQTIFRLGDKVMQIKNNYSLVWKQYFNGRVTDEGTGVFNGDEGFITKIDDESEEIEVTFDDERVVKYDYTHLDELELSYAVTIHKSQGSEYKIVIIPVYYTPNMLASRNLLYTAITRAKELVVLVGITEIFQKMIDNNRQDERYSYLKQRIIKMQKLIDEGRAVI